MKQTSMIVVGALAVVTAFVVDAEAQSTRPPQYRGDGSIASTYQHERDLNEWAAQEYERLGQWDKARQARDRARQAEEKRTALKSNIGFDLKPTPTPKYDYRIKNPGTPMQRSKGGRYYADPAR